MNLFALVLTFLSCPFGGSGEDEVTAYKAGKIITVSGESISPGVLIIAQGKILEVGSEVQVPKKASVVDLSKYTIFPGLVHAGESRSVDGSSNEESSEITPDFRVRNSFNPDSPILIRLRKMGVTTVHIEPGDRNVIGGLSSVYKTTRGAMVRPDVALKAVMGERPSSGNSAPRYSAPSFYSRRPTTRMGVVWEFRKAFIQARKSRDEKRTDISEGISILLKALKKDLPVRIYASRSFDIETAVRLAEEFGLNIQIEGAEEAYHCVKTLLEKDIPVALRPQYQTGDMYLRNGGESRLDTFARLSRAGVRVALLPIGSEPGSSLLATASFSVRCGAGRREAIRAITMIPAQMIGVSDRVGSLEPGKDADFLVLNGDPLDPKTRIQSVFINGEKVSGVSPGKQGSKADE